MQRAMSPMSIALLASSVSGAFMPQRLAVQQQQQQAASRTADCFMGEVVKLGTRGSPLALAQAYETKRRLAAAFPGELDTDESVEIVVIKTTGDMVLDKALKELGGKGLFTKELDVALLSNEVDICVHRFGLYIRHPRHHHLSPPSASSGTPLPNSTSAPPLFPCSA